MGRLRDPIPTGPFLDWCAQREAMHRRGLDDGFIDNRKLENQARHALLTDIGWTDGAGVRRLHRWRHPDKPVDGRGTLPSGHGERDLIEDALEHAGARLEDIYPDLAEHVDLEDDAYCPSCHETVTPIDGICPWCDTTVHTGDERPPRRYCAREDAMRFANNNGDCWRCGGPLDDSVPTAPCACGCGREIHRFDHHGRPVRYIHGHAPRSRERRVMLDAEPFCAWLENELHNLDPVQALARRVGLNRDRLLDLLNRREPQIASAEISRSLWLAAREGQGKGMPPRPGAPRLDDLYPDRARSKVCPECGGGKAPHAELCKRCRLKKGGMRGSRASSITPFVLKNARNLVQRDGISVSAAARKLIGHTRYTSEQALAGELRRMFRQNGWHYPGQARGTETEQRRAA